MARSDPHAARSVGPAPGITPDLQWAEVRSACRRSCRGRALAQALPARDQEEEAVGRASVEGW